MTGPGRPSTGVRVDVRIPADVLALVDALARAVGDTRAAIVREILDDWATRKVAEGSRVGRSPSA